MKPVVHLGVAGESPAEDFALELRNSDLLIREQVISIGANLL